MRTHLTNLGLEKVVAMAERAITHRSDKFAEPDAEAPDVEAGWRHAACVARGPGRLEAPRRRGAGYQVEPSEETLARIVEIQDQLGQCRGTEADGASTQPERRSNAD